MLAVVYHLQEINAFKEELHRLRINVEAFGVNHIIVIDHTGYEVAKFYSMPFGIEYSVFTDLSEAENSFPNASWVYLEPRTATDGTLISTPLKQFTHPEEDVVYVVGSNYSGIPTEGRENETWVHIPTTEGASLYADTVLSIILYNRQDN